MGLSAYSELPLAALQRITINTRCSRYLVSGRRKMCVIDRSQRVAPRSRWPPRGNMPPQRSPESSSDRPRYAVLFHVVRRRVVTGSRWHCVDVFSRRSLLTPFVEKGSTINVLPPSATMAPLGQLRVGEFGWPSGTARQINCVDLSSTLLS
jgi:hypothetical protein